MGQNSVFSLVGVILLLGCGNRDAHTYTENDSVVCYFSVRGFFLLAATFAPNYVFCYCLCVTVNHENDIPFMCIYVCVCFQLLFCEVNARA